VADIVEYEGEEDIYLDEADWKVVATRITGYHSDISHTGDAQKHPGAQAKKNERRPPGDR
jgi:hypothetical protein